MASPGTSELTPSNVIIGLKGVEHRKVILQGHGAPPKDESLSNEILRKAENLMISEKNKNSKYILQEAYEDVPDLAGESLRTKQKCSFDSYKTDMENLRAGGVLTVTEFENAEKRVNKMNTSQEVFNNLQKGFASCSLDQQNKIVDFLTPLYSRTLEGRTILKNNPSADLKGLVRERLMEGLTPDEIRGLNKDIQQWITDTKSNLDPLHEEANKFSAESKKITQEIKNTNQTISAIKAEITRKTSELETYTKAGKSEYKKITDLEGKKSEWSADIKSLPGDIQILEDQLEGQRAALRKAIEAQYSTSGQPFIQDMVRDIWKLFIQSKGGATAGGPTTPNIPGIKDIENITKGLQRDLGRKRVQLEQAIQNKEKYDELIRKRNEEIPNEIRQLNEQKLTEEILKQQQEQLLDSNGKQLAESLKKFAVFEDQLNSTLENVGLRTLIRSNNATNEKIYTYLEKAMTAVKEDHKLLLHRDLVNRFIELNPPKSVIQQIRGKIAQGFEKWYVIDALAGKVRGDYEPEFQLKKDILETDYTSLLIQRDQNALEARLREVFEGKNWESFDEEERKQLMAMYAQRLIIMRRQATGKMPNETHQAILSLHPFYEELVKVKLQHDPEYTEEVKKRIPETSDEDIKALKPDVVGNVTKTSTRDRVIFLMTVGLTLTQALSQVQHEEKPKQA